MRTLKLNLPKEPIPKLVFSNLLRRAQSNSNLSPTPTPISRPGLGLFDISGADQAALVAQARAATALSYSYFVEDFGEEEEEEQEEEEEEDDDEVSRHKEATGKRVRAPTVDNDELLSLSPPSAQTGKPISKRSKKAQNKVQKPTINSQILLRLSSPVDEFHLEKIDCEMEVQVLVNGKLEFARSYSAQMLDVDNMVTKFHVELESGPKYGGVEWVVKEPPYCAGELRD